MISKRLEELLNKQINAEFQSSYSYLAASALCAQNGFAGAAHWFAAQAEEEHEHALKIYTHLLEREGQIKLTTIQEPQLKFSSLEEIFKEALAQERKVTELLNQIACAALEEQDHTTHNFMNWFLAEQVEEIDSCNQVIDKLKLAGNNGAALLMIDSELGARKGE